MRADQTVWRRERDCQQSILDRCPSGVLAHDHHDGDEDFNPHYLVEHFMHVPPAALVRMYHNLELINETCTPANEVKRVPPDLLGTLAPGVGLLRNCAASGTPFYRIVPYRRW